MRQGMGCFYARVPICWSLDKNQFLLYNVSRRLSRTGSNRHPLWYCSCLYRSVGLGENILIISRYRQHQSNGSEQNSCSMLTLYTQRGTFLTPSLTATRDPVSKLVAKDMGSRQVECGDSTLCSITAPYTLPFKMFELMLFCNLYPKVLFLWVMWPMGLF